MWKVLGVAGLAGVAATGAAVARSERRRRAFEPDEVRARLHQRFHEAASADPAPDPTPPVADHDRPGCQKATFTRLRAATPRRRSR